MRHAAILVGLGVVLTATAAMGDLIDVPILLDPGQPDPTVPQAWICVWYKVQGPGPHPFTPAPGQNIRDVEVDIPNDGLSPFPLGYIPSPVAGHMGPFLDWQLLDGPIVDDRGTEHVYVGHWFNGGLVAGEVIDVERPDAEPDDWWYIHFTPEPATLTLLAAGGLLMLRRRTRR